MAHRGRFLMAADRPGRPGKASALYERDNRPKESRSPPFIDDVDALFCCTNL